MKADEFWAQQQFSYLVTYSFNRGPKLAALKNASKALFQATRRQLITVLAPELPVLRGQLRLLERTYDLDRLALTQQPLSFHITASPTAVINRNEVAAQELAAMLRIPVTNQTHWMCQPVYRDALAFYDEQDNLLSVLNICFSCDQMITDASREIQADTSTYQMLRSYLIQLGHPIGEEE